MSFIPTLDILSAMKVALLALQLPATYSAVADYPKAFTTVETYRNENLLKALEDLFAYDDRVALIVPAGDNHSNHTEGSNIYSARTTDVVVLIADRDYSKSQAELIGGPEAVGVVALKDLVISAFFGQNLGLTGVALAPTDGQPLTLTDKERDEATGRDCWAQTFTTAAGRAKAAIVRAAT